MGLDVLPDSYGEREIRFFQLKDSKKGQQHGRHKCCLWGVFNPPYFEEGGCD